MKRRDDIRNKSGVVRDANGNLNHSPTTGNIGSTARWLFSSVLKGFSGHPRSTDSSENREMGVTVEFDTPGAMNDISSMSIDESVNVGALGSSNRRKFINAREMPLNNDIACRTNVSSETETLATIPSSSNKTVSRRSSLVLPKFRKVDSPLAAAGTMNRSMYLARDMTAEKTYPTHQAKYGGYGLMPSVHLAEHERPLLNEQKSTGLGKQVMVKIAPPDLLKSPVFGRLSSSSKEEIRGAAALPRNSNTDDIFVALHEKRKRFSHVADTSPDLSDLESQAKRRRPNQVVENDIDVDESLMLPGRGLKRPALQEFDGDRLETEVSSESTEITKRSRQLSPSSRSGISYTVRNPIDMSYISSQRYRHRRSNESMSASFSRDGSVHLESVSVADSKGQGSREGSVQGRDPTSNERNFESREGSIALDDECLSTRGRESRASTDSHISHSESHTKLCGLDGTSSFPLPNSRCNTPVPSLSEYEGSSTASTPVRRLLLAREGTNKKRLIPLNLTGDSSLVKTVPIRSGVTIEDLETERRSSFAKADSMMKEAAKAACKKTAQLASSDTTDSCATLTAGSEKQSSTGLQSLLTAKPSSTSNVLEPKNELKDDIFKQPPVATDSVKNTAKSPAGFSSVFGAPSTNSSSLSKSENKAAANVDGSSSKADLTTLLNDKSSAVHTTAQLESLRPSFSSGSLSSNADFKGFGQAVSQTAKLSELVNSSTIVQPAATEEKKVDLNSTMPNETVKSKPIDSISFGSSATTKNIFPVDSQLKTSEIGSKPSAISNGPSSVLPDLFNTAKPISKSISFGNSTAGFAFGNSNQTGDTNCSGIDSNSVNKFSNSSSFGASNNIATNMFGGTSKPLATFVGNVQKTATTGSAFPSAANAFSSTANAFGGNGQTATTVSAFPSAANAFSSTANTFGGNGQTATTVSAFSSTANAFSSATNTFGGNVQKTATTVSAFSSTANAFSSATNTFGGNVQKTATTVSAFPSAANAFSSTANTFGGNVQTATNSFTPSQSLSSSASNNSLFNFGGSNPTDGGLGSNKPVTFGVANQTGNPVGFSKQPSGFGSNTGSSFFMSNQTTKTETKASSASVFPGTVVFGSNAVDGQKSNPAACNNNMFNSKPSASFNFAATPNTQISANTFGAPSSVSSFPSSSSSSNLFSFGSSANGKQPVTNSNAQTSNMFGVQSSQNVFGAGSAAPFGSSSSTATTSTAVNMFSQSTSIFAKTDSSQGQNASTQSSKGFNFGGSFPAPDMKFGSTSNPTSNVPAPGFNFGNSQPFGMSNGTLDVVNFGTPSMQNSSTLAAPQPAGAFSLGAGMNNRPASGSTAIKARRRLLRR